MNRFISKIPIFVLLPLIAIAFYVAVGGPGAVQAQQPAEDTVVIDLDGCAGGVINWRDGRELATRAVIDIENVALPAITLVDDVGADNSRTIATFSASPGDDVRVRLYNGEELLSEDSATIPACPTATATATPTSTATSVPATATPSPTSTPVPPPPTPIVVIQERVVTVEVPRTVVISPPSTGSAGLAAPADWDYGGGWDGGGFYAYFGW